MNNSELIRTLDKDGLLSVVDLLLYALSRPDQDFDDFADDHFYDLSDEIFHYCKGLTEYQRLKLVQLIINTLVYEAESTVRHFQTVLPLKTKAI